MEIWIVIALAGILIEMVSTQLIAIWFTVASVISAIMLYCGVATKWQWIQFLVTGIVLALLFHPFAKQILGHVKYTPLNTPETIVGKTGKVIESNDNGYRAKIADDNWKIVSNVTLQVGDTVKVKEIHGVTLTVEKLNK